MQSINLKVYVEPSAGFSPKPAKPGDAGLDLQADLSSLDEAKMDTDGKRYVDINWGELPLLISTGIRIELPDGYEATVRPRSSLNLAGVMVSLGTIDTSYRGIIKVVIAAATPAADGYRIEHGDRIAQLVISEFAQPKVEFVGIQDLSSTERGAGGFGHTGR